jgi:hypothetical protein
MAKEVLLYAPRRWVIGAIAEGDAAGKYLFDPVEDTLCRAIGRPYRLQGCGDILGLDDVDPHVTELRAVQSQRGFPLDQGGAREFTASDVVGSGLSKRWQASLTCLFRMQLAEDVDPVFMLPTSRIGLPTGICEGYFGVTTQANFAHSAAAFLTVAVPKNPRLAIIAPDAEIERATVGEIGCARMFWIVPGFLNPAIG